MSAKIFQDLNHPLQYTREELDGPFTFGRDGNFASLADVIREIGPEKLRQEFQLEPWQGPELKRIALLDSEERKLLTIELYRREPPGIRLASLGKSYSMEQLIDEVRGNTHFGGGLVVTVMNMYRHIEAAIRIGNLVLIPVRLPLTFPPLD